MKGFSKFIFIVGVILVFIGLVSMITRGALQYTYLEFKDDLMIEGGYEDMTESEIELRYEDYKVGMDKFAKAFTSWMLFIGCGCVVAVLAVTAIDNRLKGKNTDVAEDKPRNEVY